MTEWPQKPVTGFRACYEGWNMSVCTALELQPDLLTLNWRDCRQDWSGASQGRQHVMSGVHTH